MSRWSSQLFGYSSVAGFPGDVFVMGHPSELLGFSTLLRVPLHFSFSHPPTLPLWGNKSFLRLMQKSSHPSHPDTHISPQDVKPANSLGFKVPASEAASCKQRQFQPLEEF